VGFRLWPWGVALAFLILALFGLGALLLFETGDSDDARLEPDALVRDDDDGLSGFTIFPGEEDAPARLVGTAGADSLTDDALAQLRAETDVRVIEAGRGDDSIDGEGGALSGMTVYAGDGDDFIEAQNDRLTRIFGGEGHDVVAASRAIVFGGKGDDTIELSVHSDETLLAGEADGGPGNDILSAPQGAAELWGGAGDDTILAGPGSAIEGEEGDDDLTIFGNFSSARGDDGNDTLRAQIRVEPTLVEENGLARYEMQENMQMVLRGGTGRDDFVVEVARDVLLDPERETPLNLATIADFVPGGDTLAVRFGVAEVQGPSSLDSVFNSPAFLGFENIESRLVTPQAITFGGTNADGFLTLNFGTGPDTHDLTVRLNGVTDIDPALIRFSPERQELVILRAAAGA
jgi:Ca2+-binding RTX toxin-like protein